MSRDKVDSLTEKAFWTLLLAVITYCAGQAKSLNENIASLNLKMASVVEHLAFQDEKISTHDKRISALEIKRK